MEPISFTLRLEGEAVALDRGRYWAETRAPSAVCRHELEVADDGSLVQTGELVFGSTDSVTFRGRGVLGDSPDPRRRHGTAVLEVTGGRGRLAGACGYVTSNFLLADDGGLTDHHLGLFFVIDKGDSR